jgi:uncharacterized MAPEG superfamily protein
MTIAFWCVLAAALIPYLFVGYAKSTSRFVKGNHNKNPREYEEALEGARKRAYWAQLNGFEAFPPFAAGVIIAHLAGAPPDQIDWLAMAFIGCRLAHGALYIADLDKLRSVVWTAGVICVVSLFTLAASA